MSPRLRSSSKTAFEIVSGGRIAPFSVHGMMTVSEKRSDISRYLALARA